MSPFRQKRENRLLRVAWILALAALAGPGCDRTPDDPGKTVVAWLGDEPLTLAQFQSYLDTQMLGGGLVDAQAAGGEDVRSRLFDAFVEERLMLLGAERSGILVEDQEIQAYLGFDEFEEDVEPSGTVPPEELARTRLMVEKLRDEVTEGLPEPTEAEVEAYAEQNRERLLPERRLELRALAFDSEEQARKVYDEIRRQRMTFAEAVVLHESHPGEGFPLRVDWSNLSEELRAPLENLKPGRVSEPLEFHDSYYLFKVESWLREPEELESELHERARAELEALGREQAERDLIAQLGREYPVRLRLRALPFRYAPAE
jgi:hypothetical protein